MNTDEPEKSPLKSGGYCGMRRTYPPIFRLGGKYASCFLLPKKTHQSVHATQWPNQFPFNYKSSTQNAQKLATLSSKIGKIFWGWEF